MTTVHADDVVDIVVRTCSRGVLFVVMVHAEHSDATSTYDVDNVDDSAQRGGPRGAHAGRTHAQLVKFDQTPEGRRRASEAGKRGAIARAAIYARARAAQQSEADALATLTSTYSRADLGPIAIAAALEMIGRVSRGDVKVRDPAAWVRVLVDIGRTEEGQPTSITAHVNADALTRAMALRDEARRALTTGYVIDVDDVDEDNDEDDVPSLT